MTSRELWKMFILRFLYRLAMCSEDLLEWCARRKEKWDSLKDLSQLYRSLRYQLFVLDRCARTLASIEAQCHAMSQLSELERRYGVQCLSDRKLKLIVNLGHIYLENCDLGEFSLVITDPGTDYVPWCWYIEHLGPLAPGMTKACPHPHVHTGDLCTGNMTNLLNDLRCTGDLLTFVQCVHDILRTYNPDSAYARLN